MFPFAIMFRMNGRSRAQDAQERSLTWNRGTVYSIATIIGKRFKLQELSKLSPDPESIFTYTDGIQSPILILCVLHEAYFGEHRSNQTS